MWNNIIDGNVFSFKTATRAGLVQDTSQPVSLLLNSNAPLIFRTYLCVSFGVIDTGFFSRITRISKITNEIKIYVSLQNSQDLF